MARYFYHLSRIFCYSIARFSSSSVKAYLKEKRVTGGLATATKNYFTLIKDKRFLGQSLIQFFAFGAFFLPISQVHPLYTKTSSNYLHKNLAISLVSIAVVLS